VQQTILMKSELNHISFIIDVVCVWQLYKLDAFLHTNANKNQFFSWRKKGINLNDP